MINEKVNTDMVEAAGIQPGDLVLEIGPGTGSLTKALVEAGAHVIAVEKVTSCANFYLHCEAFSDQEMENIN
jgi:16S rRNA A1518/A1519 N6-dimethyltransferase RsmA/KsgA/DIM1 with predicted DNA glycosylase/AP lyase activity